MESYRDPVASAIAAGIITCPFDQPDEDGRQSSWSRRVSLFCNNAKGRITLFLGAAVSSFKPAQLPMWNQFIELIWTSILRAGTEDLPRQEDLTAGFNEFFHRAKEHVPNYLVTEVVSRRLGLQYLDLLEAFEAHKIYNTEGESWAINGIHKWAARSLIVGDFVAIVTTNFDDYLEKALEAASANCYQVTGDLHKDDREISARLPMASSSSRLVLIVNGSKAFAFIRSLMPQLGGGRITFLLKIHGSCYDPPSCIDTRLQRSQGLPSYSTDVLDTLLTRSAWLVAGFSGSDMNDNLDYLRLLSNKSHASIMWLECPDTYREKAVHELLKVLNLAADSPTGLCLLNGFITEEAASVTEEVSPFPRKVKNWAENLDRDWCKLVIIDLMALFEDRAGMQAPAELLQALNYGETPRQDWNILLSKMYFPDQQHQIAAAKSCYNTSGLLKHLLGSKEATRIQPFQDLFNDLEECLKELATQHVALESAALLSQPPRIHARMWVLSALSGLIMLCAGQPNEAAQALDMAAALSWVVGDGESHHLIQNVIDKTKHEQHSVQLNRLKPLREPGDPGFCLAFTPAMDNVNSKSNRFGIPPSLYIRALLHRSILFADGMVVPANVITGSTVFVDEILFQGELDVLNEIYAQHLFPMLPDSLKNVPRKFSSFITSRGQSYIQEPVDREHIRQLDDYFSQPENVDRISYYDQDTGSAKYGRLFRRQVDPIHAAATVEHLVQMWEHITPSTSQSEPEENSRSSLEAREAAEDLINVLRHLSNQLPQQIFRSSLYKFADLFEGASDRQAFLKDIKDDLSEAERSELLTGRRKIIEKPWKYGAFCHELFDAPYRCNMIFNHASQSSMRTMVFLEHDEVPSWQFMSTVAMSTSSSVRLVVTPPSASAEHKFSSLLLSQVPAAALMQTREALDPVRAKLSDGLELSESDAQSLKKIMSRFESRSVNLPDVNIRRIVNIEPPALKESIRTLLRHCVFLVRTGPPLHPMYEEAQLTLPGLHALRRV